MGNMKKAIICVDDEAIILYSLKQELKNHFGDEFIFETALSAREALLTLDELIADEVNVEMIISDWLMPEMKGDEFLIQVHRKYPDISSIMITGYADEYAVERVEKEAGTHVVLNKPWDSEKLLETIRVCCGKKSSKKL